MTSIEYGGGPSLEQRRRFCNLKEGGHIPGYMGFIPQFNYRNGSTFGNVTHNIAEDLPYYNGPATQSDIHVYPTIGRKKIAAERSVFKDEVPGRKVPRSTGDNKYTAGMIPGYSGDIPHLPFKFGGTYRHLCDESIDEFVNQYELQAQKRASLREVAGLFPPLRAVATDPFIRDYMNLWTDDLVKRTSKTGARKGLTEAPMPGYMGYIPREIPTELALGKRFHTGTERCLESFHNQVADHFKRLEEPVRDVTGANKHRNPDPSVFPETSQISRRIFHREGMVPSYTGHVHGNRHTTGQNYGDCTRGLEVCQHPFPTYGEYLEDKQAQSSVDSTAGRRIHA